MAPMIAFAIIRRLLPPYGVGDPCGNRTRVTAVKGPCLNLLTNGPFVSFLIIKEYPYRLIVISSLMSEIRQLSTFPGGRPPSIIDVKELNFRVRHGYGWILLAIATGFSFRACTLKTKQCLMIGFSLFPMFSLEPS